MERTTEPITVFKYGGNALGASEVSKNYFAILDALKVSKPQVIVVSAIGKTTNMLELLWKAHLTVDRKEIEEILDRIKFFSFMHLDLLSSCLVKDKVCSILNQLKDMALSSPTTNSKKMEKDSFLIWGEMISSWILSQFLLENGFDNQILDAEKFMITDLNFGAANVKENEAQKAIREKLIPAILKTSVITQGFVGRGISNTYLSSVNTPTTLGRRSSDFTAVFITKKLKDLGQEIAPVILWRNSQGMPTKDVFGSSDDFLFELSYLDARKLCCLGPKLIHPRAIEEAEKGQIKIVIKDYDRPNLPGTIIH
jgi:aspartate kinase